VTIQTAPPDNKPFKISTPILPLPTPVRRAAFLAKVTPEVAISVKTSRSIISAALQTLSDILTDVGELMTVGPTRSSLPLQMQEWHMSLLDLSLVLDIWTQEL
jgi:hypothetical protein